MPRYLVSEHGGSTQCRSVMPALTIKAVLVNVYGEDFPLVEDWEWQECAERIAERQGGGLTKKEMFDAILLEVSGIIGTQAAWARTANSIAGEPIPTFLKEWMMPGAIKMEELDEIFTYHPPSDYEVQQYKAIREAGKNLAKVILGNTPQCADQTAAIRKVREAVMTANAAIALKGAV